MPKGLTFLSAAVFAATLAMPIVAHAEPDADTVVATVNGEDITLGHMIVLREALPQQYQQLPAETLYEAMLEQLIQQVALKQSLTGKTPRFVALSLENEERSQLAALAIEDTISAITEEEARASYDAQYGNAEGGQEFDASHILLETLEDAQAVKTELDAGADFAETAKARSTGPSGPGGGGLGWFGEGRMVPEFEAAVKTLEVGEVSEPVETQFGWHIVKLNDKRTGAVPTFEEVEPEIVEQLRAQAVEQQIANLVGAADVQMPEIEGLTADIITNSDLVRN